MTNRILWVLFALLCLLIGLYPMIYFLMDEKFGLLNSKSNELLADIFWKTGFYTHIILGGLALFIGWTQFSLKLRNRNLRLHRQIGKVYVIAVLLSSMAGIGIAFFATGGFISAAGFISLGIVWFYTTLMAYVHIRKKQIKLHQNMMIYSYAACFAAVTLRLWLPVLVIIFGDFITAYLIVAWLCWVPNMIVAYLIVRRASLNLTGTSIHPSSFLNQ